MCDGGRGARRSSGASSGAGRYDDARCTNSNVECPRGGVRFYFFVTSEFSVLSVLSCQLLSSSASRVTAPALCFSPRASSAPPSTPRRLAASLPRTGCARYDTISHVAPSGSGASCSHRGPIPTGAPSSLRAASTMPRGACLCHSSGSGAHSSNGAKPCGPRGRAEA